MWCQEVGSIPKWIPPEGSQKITFDSELPVGSLGLVWGVLFYFLFFFFTYKCLSTPLSKPGWRPSLQQPKLLFKTHSAVLAVTGLGSAARVRASCPVERTTRGRGNPELTPRYSTYQCGRWKAGVSESRAGHCGVPQESRCAVPSSAARWMAPGLRACVLAPLRPPSAAPSITGIREALQTGTARLWKRNDGRNYRCESCAWCCHG